MPNGHMWFCPPGRAARLITITGSVCSGHGVCGRAVVGVGVENVWEGVEDAGRPSKMSVRPSRRTRMSKEWCIFASHTVVPHSAVMKKKSCLLVLNSVTSPPRWIRQLPFCGGWSWCRRCCLCGYDWCHRGRGRGRRGRRGGR